MGDLSAEGVAAVPTVAAGPTTSRRPGSPLPTAALAVVLLLVLSLVDLAAGPDTVVLGLLAVAPCLAAVTGTPHHVAAVGALTVAVLLLMSFPNRIWGSLEQAVDVAATVVITVVSAVVARERLRREQRVAATAEREHQLAAIVEGSDEAIIGKTLDGMIMSWNHGAERIYGYAAAEAVGRTMALIVPDERREELATILTRVASGQPSERLETRRRRKDGSMLDVSLLVSPVRDQQGRVIGASAAGHDTTEEVRAREELAASEARKSAMLQSSLDAIVVIDEQGTIIDFNPAAESTFGYLASDAVGQRVHELLVPAEDAGRCREGQAAYFGAEGRQYAGDGRPSGARRVELVARRSDGSRLPVELTVARVEMPGRPLLMGFVRDLRELRALDAERAKLEGRLAQSERMDSLGQLAGGIAHDFNNLLAVILNYASLVRTEVPEGQVREDVDAIRTAAEQAAGLTRSLLDFSRVEPVDPTDVDVNKVVTSMVGLLRRTLPENVEVVTHLTPVPPVRGDRTSLEQVVMNLAVNARDAMPDGGRLTIETAELDLATSLLGSDVNLSAGHYVRLVVTDSGHGMTDEVRRKAFDPFFTTKPKGHGTGLGLATVYAATRQLNGDVAVYSEPGRGTTVSLHLPATASVERVAPQRRAGDPQVPARQARGRTVLLVEDEDLLRVAMARVLDSEGYTVLSATSAEEALEIAEDRQVPVDLLLTDVILRGRPGPELAQILRVRWPGLAVLLASGYTERVLTDSLPPGGGWDLLEKPFTLDALLDRVSKALTVGP